jgi:hypothetical protein
MIRDSHHHHHHHHQIWSSRRCSYLDCQTASDNKIEMEPWKSSGIHLQIFNTITAPRRPMFENWEVAGTVSCVHA